MLMAVSAGIICAGICLLALWSIAGPWRFPRILPMSFTSFTWMRSLASLAMPLRDTLALGCVSSIAAIVLALGSLECAARHGSRGPGRALNALYVPLIVPQIAFLFGLEILFSYARLDGTFLAVAIVHLVFVFPYVLLSLTEPWRAWDPRYGHAIRALGRGPDTVFWAVRLPMLFRAVLTATALGFAVSVALYLPTLLIGGGRCPTVTTEAVALATGGDPRLIGATGLVQAALPFLGFAVAAILSGLLFRNRRRMRASA
jgi:putative thiamine transport system permease protein